MSKAILSRLSTMLLIIVSMGLGALITRTMMSPVQQETPPPDIQVIGTQTPSPPPSETIPPSTPLATLTPSQTLRPPPTFEPPTATVAATLTPSITPTQPIDLSISIPGLRGAETPTPSTTPGCEPRDDWKLTYTVQRDDALEKIANQYGTYASDLAAGNCLTDVNVIYIGQVLRVPGAAHPVVPEVECVPFELLTPMDKTLAIPGSGSLTFTWHGPRAPRNLIRVIRPNGSFYEVVLELRQNETIDLEDIPDPGTYTWYVYPLDFNFVQIACPEGGPWTFTKAAAPTPTPTITPFPTGP